MDVLAGLRGAAAGPAARRQPEGGGKGAGKDKGKDQLVKAMGRVLVAHERSLNLLLDRSSFVVLLKDEAVKKDMVTLRSEWRRQDNHGRNCHCTRWAPSVLSCTSLCSKNCVVLQLQNTPPQI